MSKKSASRKSSAVTQPKTDQPPQPKPEPKRQAKGGAEMNTVIEFQDYDRNRSVLSVDRRGRYYVDGKPKTIADAFKWYAKWTASPNMSGASAKHYRYEGRFLKRVAALLEKGAAK